MNMKRLKRRVRKATRRADRNEQMQARRPITIPGGPTIRLYNPFKNGPFTIKMITVRRQRNGEPVEVDQRWLVDCFEAPICHGTRKQLDRQLRRYNYHHALYIMTQGTAAEGL